MALLWARLDVNIGSHDKVLSLLADPSPKRWQAYASYMTAIGWSVGHGTDGRIPTAALPFVHGTPATARLLVKHDLWIEHPAAWEIKNYAEYQVLSEVDEKTVEGKKRGAMKANCNRWHGPDCGCWEKVMSA